MKLEELTEKLESADLLRILKGNKEIYVGTSERLCSRLSEMSVRTM